MKRGLLFFACAVLCWGGTAFAQIDPDPDGIGIYTDLTATSNVLSADSNQPVEVYLLMTRPSQRNGIAGWECSIVVPANATVWGWNIPYTCFNWSSPPEFEVIPTPPLPAADIVHLMTFIVYLTNTEPAPFYVTYCDFFNSGGFFRPVYIDNASISTILPLHTWPNGTSEPAFTFNPRPTADDETSWGEVKRLYE